MIGLHLRAVSEQSSAKFDLFKHSNEKQKTTIIFEKARLSGNKYIIQTKQCDFIIFRSIFLPTNCNSDQIELFINSNRIAIFPTELIKKMPKVGQYDEFAEYDISPMIKCKIIPDVLIATNVEIASSVNFHLCYDINLFNNKEDFVALANKKSFNEIFNIHRISNAFDMRGLANGFYLKCNLAEFVSLRILAANNTLFDIDKHTFKYHSLQMSNSDFYFVSFNPLKYDNLINIYNGERSFINFGVLDNIVIEYNGKEYSRKLPNDFELFVSLANILMYAESIYVLRFST